MVDTLDRVPAHLRRFVVQQDYNAYTAIDQAVWRFVLLQMFDRLRSTAHPAYARGLTQTGMSVDSIPRIAEMDACLARFGWGAVCVDGFIPARAFQEFQALGILPIAADMRRHENLAYTPAPDIIHEAAGHAPILPDPEYAAFLRRISECGMRAFASKRDGELFQAVRQLSIVKEQRDADSSAVTEAVDALAALVAQPTAASEATRLSRLYWWTVEYGLVGTPEDYKLYGAGLLSSLAESHFCHGPAVRKLPLTVDVVHCDYDITRPQPQLFVARDFAHLAEVLDQACAGCAFRVGGVTGLRAACEAAELATIELDSGLHVMGDVRDVHGAGEELGWVSLAGECALGNAAGIFRGMRDGGRALFHAGLSFALNKRGEGSVAGIEAAVWRMMAASGAHVEVELAAGLRASGRVRELIETGPEAARVVLLEHARVWEAQGGAQRLADGTLALVGHPRVVSVRAGVSDATYWPAQDYPEQKVPRAEPESERQQTLRLLFEQEAKCSREPCTSASLAALHERLQREFPDEWLLRWNLLEALGQLDLDRPRRQQLAEELWRLELHLERKHPIATGLGYLGYVQGQSG